jgi:hypothetical protein
MSADLGVAVARDDKRASRDAVGQRLRSRLLVVQLDDLVGRH